MKGKQYRILLTSILCFFLVVCTVQYVAADSLYTSKQIGEIYSFTSYQELLDFIDVSEIDCFFSVDCLTEVGICCGASILMYYDSGRCELVEYKIIDKNNYHLNISIEYDYQISAKTQHLEDWGAGDMRVFDESMFLSTPSSDGIIVSAPTPSTYYFFTEEVVYLYRSTGELYQIMIRLSTDEMSEYYQDYLKITWANDKENTMPLKDYPVSTEGASHFGYLLNPNTASATAENLRSMIITGVHTRVESKKAPIHIILLPSIGVMTFAAIALPIVIVKRKRKKAAMASEE